MMNLKFWRGGKYKSSASSINLELKPNMSMVLVMVGYMRFYWKAIYLKEKDLKYPICIDGDRACPPEDCGGEPGYFRLLEIISNPNHEEYEEMVEWIGRPFHPHEFNQKLVKFDNPKKRWKFAFTGE